MQFQIQYFRYFQLPREYEIRLSVWNRSVYAYVLQILMWLFYSSYPYHKRHYHPRLSLWITPYS